MIHSSNYHEQVAHVLPKENPKATILVKIDACTKTREYSRWVFIVSSVSFAASYVLNTPAVPTSIMLASGVVWGISRCLSQAGEPMAKVIVDNVIKADQEKAALNALNEKRKTQLKQQIHAMFQLDQNMRFRLFGTTDTVLAEELNKQIKELKDAHLKEMKTIISTYGWPGYCLAGEEGSRKFWLLVQHTEDLKFQELCLGHLKEAVAKGDAAKEDLAYLTDRVLMNLKLPQKYGTQIVGDGPDFKFYPIENEENVEERRKEMGLSTLVEYKAFIQKQYA